MRKIFDGLDSDICPSPFPCGSWILFKCSIDFSHINNRNIFNSICLSRSRSPDLLAVYHVSLGYNSILIFFLPLSTWAFKKICRRESLNLLCFVHIRISSIVGDLKSLNAVQCTIFQWIIYIVIISNIRKSYE